MKIFSNKENTSWKQVNLTKEFEESYFYTFRFLLYVLNFLPTCLRNYLLIKIQDMFLNHVSNKYKSKTFGGFLENRSSMIGFLENEEKYMIHLGIDFNNLEAGTEIYSPVDGEIVHVLKDKTKINGWGGRIIMKVENDKYLLFGHLAQEDLPRVGQKVSRGERLTSLGNSDENGGWFVHLHIQYITEDFYKMYANKLDLLDGYWFNICNFEELVANPMELIF